MRLLLKNYRLSDDVAFRFSDRNWKEWPLDAQRFAKWVNQINGDGYLCNLFMDYETFGEHHQSDGGILEFLSELPEQVLADKDWKFVTPSEATQYLHPVAELSFPRTTSWADTARDVSAWCGNNMQQSALAAIYDPKTLFGGREIYSPALESELTTWRRLQTSDHFYYMSTKGQGDGVVHSYFRPFESPYDAFIAYMNVLKDIASRSHAVAQDFRASANQ